MQNISSETFFWIDCYNFFTKGLLPFGVSWGTTSSKVINAIKFIGNEIDKMQEERMLKNG